MTMVMAKPRAEHGFLQRLVGTWNVTSPDMQGAPDWIEIVRSLHGIWIVAEGNGEMPGGEGPATTMLTLGFDATRGRYVGTWLGSMMDHLWTYEGDVDASGDTLSLYTIGPSMTGEGMADYREQIIFLSQDHRTFTSSTRQPDGSWKQFMEAHYHRRS